MNSLGFFLIPFLLGNLFNLKSTVAKFCLGSLLVFLATLLGSPFFHFAYLSPLIVSLSIVSFFIRRPQFKPDYFWVLPILAISTLAYLAWQGQAPYSLNWDLFHHQLLSTRIQTDHISFFTTHLSDTFVFAGYSTIFHVLLAHSQFFFPENFFQYWHVVSILQATLVSYAFFLFAKRLSGSTYAGLLAALASAFLFDSTVSFTTFFFIPQTLAAVVFMYTLIAIFDRKIRSTSELLIIFAFLFLCHYIVGLAAIAILIFTKIVHDKNLFQYDRWWLFCGFLTLALVIFIPLSQLLPLSSINQGEAANYLYPPQDKFKFLTTSFGYLFLFLPVFFAYSLYKRRQDLVLLSTLTIFSILLTFAHLPYVLKFFSLSRILIYTSLALGIWACTKYLPSFIKLLITLAFGLVCATILNLNAYQWQQYLFYHQNVTHLSQAEIDAAKFLSANYANQDYLLVSDPATMHILETLSGINTPGGAYTTLENRKILSNLSKSSLVNIVDGLEPKTNKRLLVISGRFVNWQTSPEPDRLSFSFNIWSPRDLNSSAWEQINNLTSFSGYKLVYSTPQLVILEYIL